MTAGLTAVELAERAGVSVGELEELVELGILDPRPRLRPFRPSDVQRVRLAKACESAGLPMEGIGQVIEQGQVSFDFLEATAFRRWSQRSERTYHEVCLETGIPFEVIRSILEAFGYARMDPADRIRDDELEVVPLVRQGIGSGILDEAWMTRLGRAHAQGLWKLATAWSDAYHARFETPALEGGLEPPRALEQAAQVSEHWEQVADQALMAVYRRQQELIWTEHLVEHIETALEEAGLLPTAERVPAMVFLDLVGYTNLTEERGDEVAADLAGTLSALVERSSRDHGGTAVKWLGDGIMFHFRNPGDAVVAAIEMVEDVPKAGLLPAHAGVAAGPVVAQDGDYFGRTVNLASRLSEQAGAGQVLVNESLAGLETGSVRLVAHEDLDLKGFAQPVKVFEARRR